MGSSIQIQDQPDGSISLNKVKVSGPGVTLADLNTAQTFTNKTFTGSTSTNATITTPTITNATVNGAIDYLTVATLAGLGTTIADAAPIVSASGSVIFMTGGNNSVGVILPVAVKGAHYKLKNDQAANGIMKLYPQVNSTINGLSANTAISLAANTFCEVVALNTTNWSTIPLLPS